MFTLLRAHVTSSMNAPKFTRSVKYYRIDTIHLLDKLNLNTENIKMVMNEMSEYFSDAYVLFLSKLQI